MLESLVINLPTFVSYWSGLLLAWSIVALVGLLIVMKEVYHARRHVRSADLVSLTFVSVGALALIANLFVFPDWASVIMDVTLGINLWYMLFLSYVTGTSLKLLPQFCCKS